MKTINPALVSAIGLLLGMSANTQDLEKAFLHPPQSCRPWVYWFWLNGNISSNGITADLEAMKRVGIGGGLIMEVDQGAPVGTADFVGTEWRNLFKHVVAESRRLGLEINMNNDAGWNGSGGPWIKPEESMQKVVWSETNFTGPLHLKTKLNQPETVAGYYQDLTVVAFPSVGDYRISRIRGKSLYETESVGSIAEEPLAGEMVIPPGRMVVLDRQMDNSGRLVWDVPPGNWTLLRMGHTSTGVENAPAPKTGRGLECDKLSRTGIEACFAGMMDKIIADSPQAPGKVAGGLVATHIDSWENGAQNWTAKMREEFRARRGYALEPFLPVLTGRVVGSLETSERFLWDLRQTVSELVIENYAGHMRELAHAKGLRFTVEAYGAPCDSIPYGGRSDEPMGEFWSPSGAIETCRGMASSAHVYGKPIVGAEAFTAADQEKWREHPGAIKALGDRAFCERINRFVFHRYAMQPWSVERKPGMTMGPWGQHYERTQTWWEQTPAWHEYLARCQFLLRQGLFVADLCYLQPESPPQGFGEHPRRGYDWDECGPEVVMTRMTVTGDRITLPDGMNYRVLVLPPTKFMTPELLRKIKSLVEAGATVMGTPPLKSPSLKNYPQCDQEVKQLAAEIWGDCDGVKVTQRRLGKGLVVWGNEPEKFLQNSGIGPDFVSSQPLRYIHRRTKDSDIYFVANSAARELNTTANFRVQGKTPELWWPESGRWERAAFYQPHQNTMTVGLPLGPSGSVFVLFRNSSPGNDPLVDLAHEGKSIISAQMQPPPPVIIQHATYGAPDGSRARDVRQEVQKLVDAGQRNIKPAVLSEKQDPAPGSLKLLSVDYSIGGKNYSVKATDTQTLYISSEALGIVINQARYGVLDDPKRTRDVREKAQRLVDAGENSFQVARMAEGDDPAFLVVKTLELEYTLEGRTISVSGRDPDLIVLKPEVMEKSELIAEFSPRKNGHAEATLFQPGRYTLTQASGKTHSLEVSETSPLSIEGPWQVEFAPGLGVENPQTFESLKSWTVNADPAVKYFSGSATYRKTVSIPKAALSKGKRLFLDLGRVQVMAEVKLNGRNLGLLWKRPYRLDITQAAKPGENALEIRVTNLWPNRLIGDEQLPEDSDRNPDGTLKSWPSWVLQNKPSPTGRYTFTSWRLWKKGDSLLDSGLLGPVLLVPGQTIKL